MKAETSGTIWQCVLECRMLDNDPNRVWVGIELEEKAQWEDLLGVNW